MCKFIVAIILSFTGSVFAQDNLIGKNEITVYENGSFKRQTVINPLPYERGLQNRETRKSIDANLSI